MIKSRRMRWTVHIAHVGEKNVYRILVGKRGGRRILGRPRHRQEDDIKMDLMRDGMGWHGLDCSGSE
jgi:hypothetical protein